MSPLSRSWHPAPDGCDPVQRGQCCASCRHVRGDSQVDMLGDDAYLFLRCGLRLWDRKILPGATAGAAAIAALRRGASCELYEPEMPTQ